MSFFILNASASTVHIDRVKIADQPTIENFDIAMGDSYFHDGAVLSVDIPVLGGLVMYGTYVPQGIPTALVPIPSPSLTWSTVNSLTTVTMETKPYGGGK